MLIINKGYNRKYAYGGSGIFDTISGIVSKVIGNAAVQKLATDAGKKVLETTTKKVGDFAGQKIVDGTQKLINKIKNRNKVTPQARSTLQRIIDQRASLNNLIAGSGRAKAIQDLARELNGGGIKYV